MRHIVLDLAADAPVGQEALPAETSPDKIHRYALAGDLVRLSTIDAQGHVTAIATWKKRQS